MLIDDINKLDDYRKKRSELKEWKEELDRITNSDISQSIKDGLKATADTRINFLRSDIIRYIKSNLHNIANFLSYKKYTEFNHNDNSQEYLMRILHHDYFVTDQGDEYDVMDNRSKVSEKISKNQTEFYINNMKIVSMYKNIYIDTLDYTKDEVFEKMGYYNNCFKKVENN